MKKFSLTSSNLLCLTTATQMRTVISINPELHGKLAMEVAKSRAKGERINMSKAGDQAVDLWLRGRRTKTRNQREAVQTND